MLLKSKVQKQSSRGKKWLFFPLVLSVIEPVVWAFSSFACALCFYSLDSSKLSSAWRFSRHFYILYLTCFLKIPSGSYYQLIRRIWDPNMLGEPSSWWAAGLRLMLALLNPTSGSPLDHMGIPRLEWRLQGCWWRWATESYLLQSNSFVNCTLVVKETSGLLLIVGWDDGSNEEVCNSNKKNDQKDHLSLEWQNKRRPS